ncbi:hypothetical protein C9426_05750 [Serratia sp. S1B]|nr:hypothetical protein C9426_05750 [Serratia sp. S1B]
MAFEPKYCGETCAINALNSLLTWVVICAIIFPVIGLQLWSRTGQTWVRLAAITLILVLISTLPAFSIYGYGLHKRYWPDDWKRHYPNGDFSDMVIATKPVTVNTVGSESKTKIKIWERCLLGSVQCDTKPHNVEAICLDSGTVVSIDESHWRAFQRIPEEDLQGITDTPQNMQLCSAYRD